MGRIPVLDVFPQVAGGTRPAKAVVNERLTIGATVFREGHDEVSADAIIIDPQGKDFLRIRLSPVGYGTDIFEASVRFPTQGRWSFRIEAWSDPLATWLHRAHIKFPEGQDVDLECAEGELLLDQLTGLSAADKKLVTGVRKALAAKKLTPAEKLTYLDDALFLSVLHNNPIREFSSTYGPYPVHVERQRALYGAWYEFFPRSEGASLNKDGSWTSGTFATATMRLPAVADMGFDVLYLPPIHPIGMAFRKGRNNTLTPSDNDPGSPWAIGSADGGHDAIHPDLGTEKDFVAFVRSAQKLGLEIALDFALQASPDHPWVSTHPEWFTTRADGTIAYAENPPKKYQDIYPINFDNDSEGIFTEVIRVLEHWIALGITIFRVDNPHTKPVAFWERTIGHINDLHPDVIFLAEAFTRPAMMRALAEVGFQQSYTYFTWRNNKWEIEEYVRELSGPASAYMRPNFFANTPDILPEFLQQSGPMGFAIRATLAATLSPTYGIYAGFELYECEPTKPGAEEYLNSEKYEYKLRDWDAAEKSGQSLAPYLKTLNNIRRANPALQQLRDIVFHRVDADDVLCYSKRNEENTVIVIVNLNPHEQRRTTVHLDMPGIGLEWQDTFTVRNELTSKNYTWQEHTEVYLDPQASETQCAMILSITHAGASRV